MDQGCGPKNNSDDLLQVLSARMFNQGVNKRSNLVKFELWELSNHSGWLNRPSIPCDWRVKFKLFPGEWCSQCSQKDDCEGKLNMSCCRREKEKKVINIDPCCMTKVEELVNQARLRKHGPNARHWFWLQSGRCDMHKVSVQTGTEELLILLPP